MSNNIDPLNETEKQTDNINITCDNLTEIDSDNQVTCANGFVTELNESKNNDNDKESSITLGANKSDVESPTNVKNNKSILKTNNSDEQSNNSVRTIKKSVTINIDEEEIKKFIEGDIIVDKQNPFKGSSNRTKLTTSTAPNGGGKTTRIASLRKKSSAVTPDTDQSIITKQDVLNESKYVKTYIKNPDKVFIYDPTLIQRLQEQEEREKLARLQANVVDELNRSVLTASVKRSKATRSKVKPQIVPRSKVPVESGTNGVSKVPKYRTSNKSTKNGIKYPDLSDIKVKTGTDLEESLYDPVEVAQNAKLFDECTKELKFSEQDDSDTSDIVIPYENFSALQVVNNKSDKEFVDTVDSNLVKEKKKKTFSNTITSKAFQEYLRSKGLTLTAMNNRNQAAKMNGNTKNNSCTPIAEETVPKSPKKNVLQRLFHVSRFSSKRKTIPKDLKQPQNQYSNNGNQLMNNEDQKRVVLKPIRSNGSTEVELNNTTATGLLIPSNYRPAKNTNVDTVNSKLKKIAIKPVPIPAVRKSLESQPVLKSERQASITSQSGLKPMGRIPKPTSINQNQNPTVLKPGVSVPFQRTTGIRQSVDINNRKPMNETLYGNINRSVSLTIPEIRDKSNSLREYRTKQINANQTNPYVQIQQPAHLSSRLSHSLQSSPVRNPVQATMQSHPKLSQNVRVHSSMQNMQPNEFNQKITKTSTPLPMEGYPVINPANMNGIRVPSQSDIEMDNYNIYERLSNIPGKMPFDRNSMQRGSLTTGFSRPGSSLDYPTFYPLGNPQFRGSYTIYNPPNELDYGVVEPRRCQSSLGALTGRQSGEPVYGVVNGYIKPRQSGVELRRKPMVSMSREEILAKVKEFCKKSMNKTNSEKMATEKQFDSSPVSYASVRPMGMSAKKIPPQVPRRIHSLQSTDQLDSPSAQYATVRKQENLHMNGHPIPTSLATSKPYYHQRQRVNTDGSDTDSVFLPDERVSDPRILQYQLAMQARKQHWQRQQRPQQMPVRTNQNVNQLGKTVILNKVESYYRPIMPSRYQDFTALHRPQSRQIDSDYGGSDAEEIQYILNNGHCDEDWQNDKSGRHQQNNNEPDDRRRTGRREDPRRHTLGSDMLQYANNHQGGPQMHPQQQAQQHPQRTMDLEMGMRVQKSKKTLPVRGYAPVNQGPLFDEDPGIMSEVETACTGFRRGGKQRSSLPVVRTPSKTLERPLGLVFLQYRSETKRALLPNEITSIDTVRALFVRSFPRQLTMAYLEGPNVKIYIHDANKDMFYELEDVRSHLREIRDRSVLRLFESNEVVPPQALPGGPGVPQPLPQNGGQWDQDQSYFSEPEFDTEFSHQHVHKNKGGKGAPYYVGGTQTLPRSMYTDRNRNAIGNPVKPLRSYGSRGNMGPPYSYPTDQLYSIPDGYMSSPERGTRGSFEEPAYYQYAGRGNSVTPVIDEEQSEMVTAEDQYGLYGVKVSGRLPRNANTIYDTTRPELLHRMRVEHMERQLANLTGVVRKALVHNPQLVQQFGPEEKEILELGGLHNGTKAADNLYVRAKPPKLGKQSSFQVLEKMDKSEKSGRVSFEKSVSFSDEIQIQDTMQLHSPQHHHPSAADSKPAKPAIKSSTLPRTSSQERDRSKPPPPPKPLGLSTTHPNYKPEIELAPEVYNHLRGLQKKAKDLRMEVRSLRRLSQAQSVAVREDIKNAFMRIRATMLATNGNFWHQNDQENIRISRDEELYKQEVIRLEKDLADLESSVEGLRGEVINRRTRVNMAAVEDMALVLSRASKTVAELKMRFPHLQQELSILLSTEMEKMVREEKFLKEEPDRLESALRRCKKLTGTLVTLKRLASVQEQRLPVGETPIVDDGPRSADIQTANKPVASPRMGTITVGGNTAPENALDALLDELQTFAKPNPDGRLDDSTSEDGSQTIPNTVSTQLPQSGQFANEPIGTNNTASLRRLASYPSGSDTDTSPPQMPRATGKPPVPERNTELLSRVNKRIPPPPPPRTSSRSPLASPTTGQPLQRLVSQDSIDLTTLNEDGDANQRQMVLEQRHQELLKKQRHLQEQYARLQQISAMGGNPNNNQIQKTGSESNLPQKMGMNMSVVGGSMRNLHAEQAQLEAQMKELALQEQRLLNNENFNNGGGVSVNTTIKQYETEIL